MKRRQSLGFATAKFDAAAAISILFATSNFVISLTALLAAIPLLKSISYITSTNLHYQDSSLSVSHCQTTARVTEPLPPSSKSFSMALADTHMTTLYVGPLSKAYTLPTEELLRESYYLRSMQDSRTEPTRDQLTFADADEFAVRMLAR